MRRIGRSTARTSTTSPTAIGMSSRPSTETSASWASTTVQRTTCSRADDDRPDGRQVGGDRRDDEVPADRVEDRAAGRERIAGRAGRAGDDEAVGDERGEVRVVDGDVEPADPRQRAARDDDVVEGDVARVVDRLRRRAGSGPRAPSARRSRSRPSTILPRTCLELAGLGLRQEADLAEVDAEDRDVDLGHGANRAQERAVATEHDEGVGRGAARGRAPPGRPTGPASGRCRASGTSRRRGHSARRLPRSSGCRRNRCASTVTAGVTRRRSGRRSPRNPGRRPGGPGTRDCPRAR